MFFLNKYKLIFEIPKGVFLLKKGFNQEGNWRSDSSYKFIYSLDGFIEYQTNRNQFTLEKQHFIIFNPHDEHKQLTIDGKKFLIELNPSLVNEIAKMLSPIHYDIQFAFYKNQSPQLTNWVQFILQYIQSEEDTNNKATEHFLDHSFTQLALLLVKSVVGTHSQDINLNTYKMISPQLFKTIQALKENYQHHWSLDEMASISGLNKFQFAHYFKEIIGISPYSWLQIYRVIRGQEMLKNSNQTVLDIAMHCGFSSVGSFNHLFRRLYGITPLDFRKMTKR